MKFILLVTCILASAMAQSPAVRRTPWRTLRSENINAGNGNFYYDYLTENGIQEHRLGTVGSRGQSNMEGSYSYTHPDGRTAVVTWIADENGYRATGPVFSSVGRNNPTYNTARRRYDSLINRYRTQAAAFRPRSFPNRG